MKKLRRYPLYLFLFVFVFSCSDDETKPKSLLVKAELFRSFRAENLQSLLAFFDIGLDPSLIKYDVDMYKVTYLTNYKGQEIEASGLVILPVNSNESLGMVSFQHGTIASHAEAPSMITPGDQAANLYAALATPGFIIVVPDFIGFGASDEVPHPYYVEDATASAVIDNLRAAKILAEQKSLTFNGKLFLAGYSQGGYATLAAHKEIEENGLDGFDLQASFPAAGGYDVKGMQEYFFSLDSYHEPFYITYVAHAYTNHYDWTEPYSNFFNEPYASKIPVLFDGTKSASAINNELTDDISDLINGSLLSDITQPKYDYIENAFIENSLLDWTPEIPIFFYHGDADITVPYQNSVDSYNAFVQNGTDSNIISLTTLEGADHGSGVFPYIQEFIPILLSMK